MASFFIKMIEEIYVTLILHELLGQITDRQYIQNFHGGIKMMLLLITIDCVVCIIANWCVYLFGTCFFRAVNARWRYSAAERQPPLFYYCRRFRFLFFRFKALATEG